MGVRGAPNLKQRIPTFKNIQPSAQTYPVVLGHSRYLLYFFGKRSLFLAADDKKGSECPGDGAFLVYPIKAAKRR